MDRGVIIVDGHCDVQFANRAAEQVMRESAMVTSRDHKLRFRDTNAQAIFADVVAQADLSRHSSVCTRSFTLPLDIPPFRLRVTCFPLPPHSTAISELEEQDKEYPAVRVMLLISDPRMRIGPESSILVGAFGLTPREAELAVLLAQGGSIRDFAALHEVSLSTARTHLVNLRQKLAARTQADVIRTVLSLNG